MPTHPDQNFEQLRPDLAQTLEEFDLAADRMGFVGLKIAPVLEVDKQHGVYPKIELKELLKNRETARASDGTYNRGQGKGSKDNYECAEHGFEEAVDQRDQAIYGELWDAEQLAAERSRDPVLRNHNQRVIDAALAITNTTAAGTVWSTAASATPIANVSAARIAIRNRTGYVGNAMVIDWEAFEELRDCDEIVNRIKYSGIDDPKKRNISVDAVAAALGLDHLDISGSIKNTANEAQAASISSMWTKTKALVYYKSTSRDLTKPQFMRTFHWGADGSRMGGLMESYYSPDRRCQVVRHRMETDEKIVYPECAQVITGVL